MNLTDRHRIQVPLNHAEHAAKPPGSINNIQLSQPLGVMVLGDSRRLLDVAVHRRDLGHADSLHVHDCAACFEEFTGFAGAGRETWVCDFFVFDDEVLEHAFAGGEFVEGVEVDVAVLFDVDWAAVLVGC